METLKILVVEHAALIRGAFVALIDGEQDFRVVAAAKNGSDAVQAVHEHKPDIAVIDIDLPDMDGITVAAQLDRELSSCRSIILTSQPRTGIMHRILDSPVSGYLLKDAPPEQLASTIRNVATGLAVIDMKLTATAWERVPNPLSKRELEVLRLAAGGSEPSEIAAALHLSVGTVRNYLTVVVSKLNARNRIDAVKNAMDIGLLPLPPLGCRLQ